MKVKSIDRASLYLVKIPRGTETGMILTMYVAAPAPVRTCETCRLNSERCVSSFYNVPDAISDA
ncbi:MAG TPA: hypothetical protein VK487_09045 [Candidatus Bathyarchaeia archaeon]|nr:hypothetical protein [Candidatus Bathyarchaeia archaeon]